MVGMDVESQRTEVHCRGPNVLKQNDDSAKVMAPGKVKLESKM